MQITTEKQRAIGMLFLRLLLGFIFLMQGFGKVFIWGVDGVYQNAFASLESSWIPVILLKATAYFTSYAELVGGLLLIVGFWKQWVYILLAVVLVLVTYGHGLESPIWDLQHVFFRSAILAALFFLPKEWDRFHFDR